MESPQRVLFDEALARWRGRFQGLLLDVGGGRRPYGATFAAARALVLDLEPGPRVDACADLKDGLPIRSAAVDGILALNLFEHLADPWTLVREFHRVLRPGGMVLHYTPYLYPEHADPRDYWRFSPDGLRLLYAAFEELSLEALGGPRTLALGILHPRRHFYRRYLLPLLMGWARRGDARDPARANWASGHLAVWRKSLPV